MDVVLKSFEKCYFFGLFDEICGSEEFLIIFYVSVMLYLFYDVEERG